MNYNLEWYLDYADKKATGDSQIWQLHLYPTIALISMFWLLEI